MKLYSGLELYRRVTNFIMNTPEYIQLEKSHSNAKRGANDLIVDLEVANDLFVIIEKEFTEILLTEALNLGQIADGAGAQEVLERKANLRNRLVTLSCQSSKSLKFEPKVVHSIILKIAHRGGILAKALEKVYRSSNDKAVLTVEFSMLKQMTAQSTAKIERTDSVYIHLAEYYKIITAFHRGIEMGKLVQFQHRFSQACVFLNQQIETSILENENSIKNLALQEMVDTAFLSFTSSLSFEERTMLLKKWNMGSSRFNYKGFEDSKFLLSDFACHFSQFIQYYGSRILIRDPFSISNIILKRLFQNSNFSKFHVIDSNSFDPGFSERTNLMYDNFSPDEAKKFKSNDCIISIKNSPTNLIEISNNTNFNVIDLHVPAEILELIFYDLLIKCLNPEMYVNQQKASIELFEMEQNLQECMQKLFDSIKKDPNCLDDVEFMLFVIKLRRRYDEIVKLKENLEKLKVESYQILHEFRNISVFLNKIFKLVKKLEELDIYSFSLERFCFIVCKCASKERNSEFLLDSLSSENFADELVLAIDTVVSGSILPEHRFVFSTAIKIIKELHFNSRNLEIYPDFIESILELSSLVNLNSLSLVCYFNPVDSKLYFR